MNASDAAILVEYLEQHDLEVYIDGGWAVDALLVEHTRSHADPDIAAAGANVHGVAYRSEHLTGEGFIDGYPVPVHLAGVAREVPHGIRSRRERLSRRPVIVLAIRYAATR